MTSLLGAQRSDENGRLIEIDDSRLNGDFDETLTIQDLMNFDRKSGVERIVSTEIEMYMVIRTTTFNDTTFLVPRGFTGGAQINGEGNNENINWSEWLNRSGGVRTSQTSNNGARTMFSLVWQGKYLNIRDLLILHNVYGNLFDELNNWSQTGFSGGANLQFYTRGEWLTERERPIWQTSA